MAKRKQKGTGIMSYVPRPVLVDINMLMESKNIKKSEAFSEMAAYARVGIEAENILKFRFPNTKKLIKLRRRR